MAARLHARSLGHEPSPLLSLAAFTRTAHIGSDARAVAVPTASGWITLHASLPDGGATGRVAIVLERATSPQSTAVALEAQTSCVTPCPSA